MPSSCQRCGTDRGNIIRTSPDPQAPNYHCRPCLVALHEQGLLAPAIARLAGIINPAPPYVLPRPEPALLLEPLDKTLKFNLPHDWPQSNRR